MKRISLIALTLIILSLVFSVSAEKEKAVSLDSLEPFEKEGIRLDAVLMDGKDLYEGIYTSCFGPKDDSGYVEYLLNGRYIRLDTVLYITGADLSPYYDYTWDAAVCRIYGDEELLFEQIGFQHKDEPQPLSLDVSGVKFLRIEFDKAAYYNTGAGRPLILLGNSMLVQTAP